MTVVVELQGLEVHGHHGVEDDERERGQRFLFDVRLEVADDTAARTDRVEDTVDYRDVVTVVREVSDGRAFRLLEALATAVAERLGERLPIEGVEVRVRKPDVRLAAPVEHAAVSVEWRRPSS